MTIIPAIDIISGRCVRLRQGSFSDTTVYDEDPATVARRFVADGAQRIHLVDLDAARGSGDNRETIASVRAAVDCVLELGGGVRSLEAVRELFDLGVEFAVLGTVLLRRPDEVERWADVYGKRMIASIDAHDGMVRVAGWQEESSVVATELAERIGALGFAAIEYTDIGRDGMLVGPDIDGGLAIARAGGIPTILSGGVSRTGDAVAVAEASGGEIAGLIVGRAIYEGTFDLKTAIARRKEGTRGDDATADRAPR